MKYKPGFIILKYLLQKPILHKFLFWVSLVPAKKPRNVSKIPVPRFVKENSSRERKRPESPCLRIPKSESNPKANSTRPTSAPPKRENISDDFGSRLHNKAQEIEIKKQKIRKALKVDYSFRPKLAEHTNRWLNRSNRENKGSKEEIAVVSSASILNFTRSVIPSSIMQTTETEVRAVSKVKPVVITRRDFKFTDNNIKENEFL